MTVPMPDVSGTGDVGNSITGPEVTDNSGGDSGNGLNPAWNDLLQALPSSLHSQVTPHLKKWDQNFQAETSKYDHLKPYLDIPAEELEGAIGLYRAANSDPRRIWEEMGTYYGFAGDQGQGNPEQNNDEVDLSDIPDDLLQHPKIKELMENQGVLAQVILQQQQQEADYEASRQLDDELASVVEKHPEFGSEERQVMILNIAMAQNLTVTEAAEQLAEYNRSIAQASQAPPAPNVMGGNGQLPSNGTIDPSTLSPGERRKLVQSLIQNGG